MCGLVPIIYGFDTSDGIDWYRKLTFDIECGVCCDGMQFVYLLFNICYLSYHLRLKVTHW